MTRIASLHGTLSRHPDGYGFVRPRDSQWRQGEIFIPPGRLGTAIDGDLVLVRAQPSSKPQGGWEGEVVRVIERPRRTLAGKVFRYRKKAYVRPLDDRYPMDVRLADDSDAPSASIVAIELVNDPNRKEEPLGKLLEVLGNEGDPGIQYRIVCCGCGIRERFPDSVLDAAEAAEAPDDQEFAGRLDLREEAIVTIDGEDARDFDDAIGVERLESGGFRLGVHIADVSRYVPLDGLLDEEALLRGTSTYFPDRVYPMLPERLSNDLCSLRPREDRLTVSALMEFDSQGNRTKAEFAASVIRSRHRMTYEQVQVLAGSQSAEQGEHEPMDEVSALRNRHEDVLPMLRDAFALSRKLREVRLRRGAIDFDLPEARVFFDDQGEVIDIQKRSRLESHRLIEEFMLAANEAVAEFVTERGVGMVYRVHDEPDPGKVERFQEVASQFGHSLGRPMAGGYPPAAFQRVAARMAGRPEASFLSYLMLRSFAVARYSNVNAGHFGLASSCYTHFTSPIRRYPDLVVHRLLKAILEKREKTAPSRAYAKRLASIAEQSSQREQASVEAERSILRWMRSRLMSPYLGDEFSGRITNLMPMGFYVELDRFFIEGFVSVSTLIDDDYRFRKESYALVAVRSRRAYRLGDKVNVRVDRVDRLRGQVDFSVV